VRPLAIDLFTGLHGWADGLIAEGFRVVGFDLEDMSAQFGQPKPPHFSLVIQNVLTLHGAQFKDAALIVASPPCQSYSYRAMPWSRAKALPPPCNALFEACFRIQAQASLAASHHIPLVVENVRGAQPWVGRARWNFGSYYLWGDVPALMPPVSGRQKMALVTSHISDGQKSYDRPNGVKVTGLANGRFPPGGLAQGHLDGIKGVPHRTAGHWTNPAEHEGLKQPGIDLSDVGFNVANARQFAHMVEGVKIERSEDDKRQHIGTSRKFASAMIAKIPLPLSRHIARVYLP
jgi:hypothetical protein